MDDGGGQQVARAADDDREAHATDALLQQPDRGASHQVAVGLARRDRSDVQQAEREAGEHDAPAIPQQSRQARQQRATEEELLEWPTVQGGLDRPAQQGGQRPVSLDKRDEDERQRQDAPQGGDAPRMVATREAQFTRTGSQEQEGRKGKHEIDQGYQQVVRWDTE